MEYTMYDIKSSPYDKPATLQAELEKVEFQLTRRPEDEGLKMAAATLKNWYMYSKEKAEEVYSTEGMPDVG